MASHSYLACPSGVDCFPGATEVHIHEKARKKGGGLDGYATVEQARACLRCGRLVIVVPAKSGSLRDPADLYHLVGPGDGLRDPSQGPFRAERNCPPMHAI